MKKPFLLFCVLCTVIGLQAAVSKTVNLTTAGTLSTMLTATELTTITDLTLTGNIDARDFVTLRDKMTVLANIDMSAVTVEAYDTCKVNTIPTNAFYNNPARTMPFLSIKLPNTITTIGDWAFGSCTGLTAISFPNSLTKIGSLAFYGCSGLNSISLPSSMTTIEGATFSGCSGLTSFNIPSSVTTIGVNAFAGCSGLTSINIPNSVTTISGDAFFDCSGLRTINIPSSVTAIGIFPFNGCSSLSSIKVFNPTPVSLSSNLIGFGSISIPLYVPAGSKAAYVAADYWKNFTTIIEFNPNVVTINNTAGGLSTALSTQLSSITKLTVTGTIDARDFKTMRDLMPLLEEVDLSGATVVAYTGTEGTKGTTSTVYDANIIPVYSFFTNNANTSLKSIKLPSSVTSIGESAFMACRSLNIISIPSSVISIGATAFADCGSLTTIGLPNSVTSIGYGAFYQCFNLKAISLPRSVISIGGSAFAHCGLSSIRVYNQTPVALPTDVFTSVPKTIPLYVPAGSKAAYTAAEVWKEFTNIIEDSNPFITLSSSTFAIPAVGSVKTTEVTSNTVCTATSDAAWLRVSLSGANFASASSTVNFGSASETTTALWFVAASNTTTVERTGRITVVASGVTKQISVTQAAGDALLSISSSNKYLDYKANSTASIDVTSNMEWTATSDHDWLNVGLSSGAAGSSVTYNSQSGTTITALRFVATSELTSNISRVALVTVSANGAPSRVIEVYQSGAPILPSEVFVDVRNSKISYKVQTLVVAETEENAKVSSNQSWLEVSVSVGAAGYYIQATSFENTGAKRTAEVTVSVEGKTSKVFTVTQEAAPGVVETPELSVSTSSVTFTAARSTAYTTVTANKDWIATADAEWLQLSLKDIDFTSASSTVSFATATSTSTALWFVAASNTSTVERTGTITIVAGNVTKKITVTQAAGDAQLSISSSYAYLDYKANSTASIDVTSNMEWTATSDQDWLKVGLSSDAVNSSISFNSKNSTTTTALRFVATSEVSSNIGRTAHVTVSANGAPSRVIEVGQTGAPILPSEVFVDVRNTNLSYHVQTVEIAETEMNAKVSSSQNWLEVLVHPVTAGYLISATTFANTGAKRTAEVTVTVAGKTSKVFTVTQEAAPAVVETPELSVSTSAVTFPAATSTAYTTVTANKDWTATSDADWLQISLSGIDLASASSSVSFATTTSTTAALWFVAASNTSTVERSAIVTIVMGDITKQVIIMQAAKKDDNLPEMSLEILTSIVSSREQYSYTVARIEYGASATSDQAWANVSTGSAAAGYFVFLSAKENVGSERSAVITVSINGKKSKTFIITQAASTGLTPQIDVASERATVDANGLATVAVKTNVLSTVTADADWLHVSLTNTTYALSSTSIAISGSDSYQTLWFVAASNTTTSDRSAKVIISSGDSTEYVIVYQAAAPVVNQVWLKVTSDTIAYNAQTSLKVAETEQFATAASNQLWLKAYVETAMAGYYVRVDALENKGEARSAVITVTLGDKISKFTIVQASPVSEKLTLSTNSIAVKGYFDKAYVDITSSAKWQYQNTASWIKVDSTTNRLIFLVSENTAKEARTAQIKFLVNGKVLQTLRITQDATTTPFVSAPSETTVSAAATSIHIPVTSNIIWSAVTIESWTTTTQTVTAGNGEIIVSMTANTSVSPRSAKILLTGIGVTAQTVLLTQAAGTTDAPETSVSSIAVYPNPTTEYFMLNTNARLTVYNQAGTCMFVKQVVAGEAIALDTLSVGTYKVVIETPSSRTTQQLIKQ